MLRGPWRTAAAVTLALTAMLAGACGKKHEGPPHVPGTPHTDEVIEAWKDEGLAPDTFTFTDPAAFGAGYCATGRVAGLEALICEYADDESVSRGKKIVQGQWDKQKLSTGVLLQSKRTLLAISDRAAADTGGRTINRLVKVFKKL